MTNLELLKYCYENPEKFLDKNYMFPEKDPQLSQYVAKTKSIKNKLIAIKEIIGKAGAGSTVDAVLADLSLELRKHANYSEFGAFVNACDSNIHEVSKHPQLLKTITLLYLQKRDLNDIVPSEWIQAIIDKGASRKKGSVGEKKLADILSHKGYRQVHKMEDFMKGSHVFAKFTKNGDFSHKNIKKVFGIRIGSKTQNKKLDLFIKTTKNKIYLLEAKHLNVGGGEQDKQIKELIDILNLKSGDDSYHFISYLDGIHSNTLLNPENRGKTATRDNKVPTQYRDILRRLKNNPRNYWINTAGFEKLFVGRR